MSTPQPNVGVDLVRIHKVITRGLAVVADRSQGSGPEPARRAGFQAYVRALTALLRAHHDGEDELAFPFWRAKAPQAPIDKLAHHHRLMTPLLDKMQAWLDTGEAGWADAPLAGLHADVEALNQLWRTHIRLEEAVMGPDQAGQMLTPEENAQLGAQLTAHGQQHAQPSELVLPFVLYNLPLDDRQAMMAVMPPVVTGQLIPIAWKAAWEPMQPFLLE